MYIYINYFFVYEVVKYNTNLVYKSFVSRGKFNLNNKYSFEKFIVLLNSNTAFDY